MKQPYECNNQLQVEKLGVTSKIFQFKYNTMKKSIYFILVAIIFMAFACKKETEVFSFYRSSNPQNFKTVKGGEIYAFAANDSVIVRADYYLKILGQIQNYGSEILHYGFTWSSTITKPVLGSAACSDTIIDASVAIDTLSFTLPLINLTPNTKYNVRSFVITEVDTAYNPVILEVTTKDAIDAWFIQEGENLAPGVDRFDALAFNFGDTVFFGTGDKGFNNIQKDIWMYDPKINSWAFFSALPKTFYPKNTSEMTDGIGFAIAFEDIPSIQGQIKKFMYIGLGDFGGNDVRNDKSRCLQSYDLVAQAWDKPTSDYAGGPISGAVSFVIGDRAYVGTGSNTEPTKAWYVYCPAFDRDGVGSTEPWQSLENLPGGAGSKRRKDAIAFTVNGRGYFGLGRDEAGNFLKDFYEFRPNFDEPTKGTWIPKADFPGAARANASAFAIGDQGYVGTGDNFVTFTTLGIEGVYGIDYSGEMFEDFYRYDPFNNKWFRQADYTSDQKSRIDSLKKVTRGVGFSIPSKKVGFIGYGIVPTDVSRAQTDLWMYQPFESGAK